MLNQSYAYCSPNLHIPATFGYAQMIVFDVFGFLDHVYYFSFMCIQICSLCFVCCFCSCIKDPVGTNTHRCAAYESMYLPWIYVDIAHSCLASLLVHHHDSMVQIKIAIHMLPAWLHMVFSSSFVDQNLEL